MYSEELNKEIENGINLLTLEFTNVNKEFYLKKHDTSLAYNSLVSDYLKIEEALRILCNMSKMNRKEN